jgi:transposase
LPLLNGRAREELRGRSFGRKLAGGTIFEQGRRPARKVIMMSGKPVEEKANPTEGGHRLRNKNRQQASGPLRILRSAAGRSNWSRGAARDGRGAERTCAPEDLRRIEREQKRGPEALGYETGLWTSAQVAHLIESECGGSVSSRTYVADFAATGMGCQRPTARARERDEAAIQRWKQKRWPEIK